MATFTPVVVPAIPPRPPQLSLINSAIKPDGVTDPSNPIDDISNEQRALLPADLRSELSDREGPSWVRGFTYAPENHWSAILRDPCDGTSVDLPALPAPLGLALAQSTGGTLANGAYAYQVTAVNPNGETTALAATTITVSAGGGTASVVLTWQKVNETATYNIYGRVSGSIGKLATVGPFDDDQAATYKDTGAPSPGAAPPVSNTTAGVGTYSNLAINTVIPPVIEAQDFCSSFGFEERDFKGRAQRLLENAQHQAIEKEFWTGTLAQAKGYPNRYLTDGNLVDVTPATPPSPTRGLQILQDSLASCGFGGQGMIHVQPQTAPNLLGARRVGNLLLDIFDNIIVPGVGYTGAASAIGGGAASGTAVMIATDLAMVRVENEGTVYPDTFAEAMDWGQAGQPNTIRFRAEKFGVAYFDGACQFGVRVTLTS